MNRLNQALLSCLLVATTLTALRLMQLASTLEDHLAQTELHIAATASRLDSTLLHVEALLSSLRGTAEDVRRSSTSQLGYYEAIGRRSALLLGEGTILLRHADGELRRLARSSDDLLRQSQAQLDQLAHELQLSARAATESLQSAGQLADTAQARLQAPEVSATLANLSTASGELARSAATSAEAVADLRAIISPERKGFWRRLLEAFIPRPSRRNSPQSGSSR